MDQCALCASKDIRVIPENRRVVHWICSCCKEVIVSDTAFACLSKYADDFWYISSFCRKRALAGLPPKDILYDDIEKIIENVKSERPQTFLDAQDRVLLYFGERAKLLGGWCDYDQNLHLEVVLLKEEAEFIIEAIQKQGILEIEGGVHYLEDGGLTFGGRMRLTPEGWKRYYDLIRKKIDSNNVFIAMWFSDKTEMLRKSFKAGIEAAGYNPVIVDEREFTGNIMDFVLARIRDSKLIIADFTVSPEEKIDLIVNDEPENTKVKKGSRGGVYYEAGFARGLGLQVIHTCKRDNISLNRLHFDVMQENTIFWRDEDIEQYIVRFDDERLSDNSPRNLSEKIYDRIVSIAGYGNLKSIKNNTTS